MSSSNSGRGLSDLYARVNSGSKESQEQSGKRRRSLSPVESSTSKSGRYERHRDRYERNDRDYERVDSGRERERTEERRERHDERRERSERDSGRERERERERERDSGREREKDSGRERERDSSSYDRSHDRRESRFDRTDRYERTERDDRSSRYERDDRYERSRIDHRNDRFDNRTDRNDRFDNRTDRNDRFDRNDRYDNRRSRNSSVQIPFDRFARLSPWNGPACPLEERTRHLRNWDLAPAGFERVSADKAKATGLFPPPGNVAKVANYLPPTLDPARVAMLQLLTGGAGRSDDSSASASAALNSSAALSTNPAIVKQARRFYLGNLPNPLHESQLTDFLERNLSGLAAAGPDAPKRIVSVNVSTDRSYAFVEVKTAEDATMAMNLDGVLFQGVQLKVRRPKEYHLAMTAQQEESKDASSSITNSSSSSSAKMELLPRPLILSEIPDFLTEAHLRALLGLVAEVRQFVFIKAQGVAVFEFVEDEQGEEWSGPLLKHTQGSIFVGPFEMKLERLIDLYSDASDSQEEKKRLRNVLSCFNLQPGYATAPHSTPVLQLLNLVTPESLEAAADEIEADLLAELKTFTAHPESLELFLPRPRGNDLVPGVGRVFVKFAGGVEEAARAAGELAGRIFDGRTCIVSFYPEDKYEKRQF